MNPKDNIPSDEDLDSEFDDFEDGDDYYDEHGNCSAGGMYDAGGHLIPERWADYADMLRDRRRDEGF